MPTRRRSQGSVSARGRAASQYLLSHFESRVGSETAPAQFREPRRPEPTWAAAVPAQQVTRARLGARRPQPRRLTISERPSRQAFWKRAWRSSWGRSLKPVYLICKAETARNQEPNPRRCSRARPPRAVPIRTSRVCGQTPARARLPLRRRRRGAPGHRAAQTFLRPGPLRARRGLRAARPPHLTFAAQLPEELLVLELASLVGHDTRHLPALRPRRPAGLRACAGTRWPAPR